MIFFGKWAVGFLACENRTRAKSFATPHPQVCSLSWLTLYRAGLQASPPGPPSSSPSSSAPCSPTGDSPQTHRTAGSCPPAARGSARIPPRWHPIQGSAYSAVLHAEKCFCVCVCVSSGLFLSRIVTESIYLRRPKLGGQHHKMTLFFESVPPLKLSYSQLSKTRTNSILVKRFSLRKLIYHVDTVKPELCGVFMTANRRK